MKKINSILWILVGILFAMAMSGGASACEAPQPTTVATTVAAPANYHGFVTMAEVDAPAEYNGFITDTTVATPVEYASIIPPAVRMTAYGCIHEFWGHDEVCLGFPGENCPATSWCQGEAQSISIGPAICKTEYGCTHTADGHTQLCWVDGHAEPYCQVTGENLNP